MPGNIEIEHIYKLWDEALGKKDLEASLALYADDASIESPLVQHLMKTGPGWCKARTTCENSSPWSFKPPLRNGSDFAPASSPTDAL